MEIDFLRKRIYIIINKNNWTRVIDTLTFFINLIKTEKIINFRKTVKKKKYYLFNKAFNKGEENENEKDINIDGFAKSQK